MNNDTFNTGNLELSDAELESVSGGLIWEAVAGWLIGKGLDALAHATDHTPTNVLNGMLILTGRKPI